MKAHEVTINTAKTEEAHSSVADCTKSDATIAQVLARDIWIDGSSGKKRPGPKSKTRVVPSSSESAHGTKSKKRKANDVVEPYTSEPDLKKFYTMERKLWYDGTEYQCQICSEIFFQVSALMTHILSEHKMSKDGYISKYKKLVTSEAVYMCQVCNEMVEHTKLSISR